MISNWIANDFVLKIKKYILFFKILILSHFKISYSAGTFICKDYAVIIPPRGQHFCCQVVFQFFANEKKTLRIMGPIAICPLDDVEHYYISKPSQIACAIVKKKTPLTHILALIVNEFFHIVNLHRHFNKKKFFTLLLN